MSRTVVLMLSDTHAGFKFGLMNPNVKLYDWDENGNAHPYTPALTAVQEHFWKVFTKGCKVAKEYANGDPIVVIHCGDITHGNVGFLKSLVSTELADQPAIAISNLEPLLTIPNVRSFRLVSGTGVHNFDESNAEKLIIENVKLLYPDINSEVVTHGLASVDGVKIEYAHQGAFPGSKFHLKGNVAHQFLRDRMTCDLIAGKTPPRIYAYGHYHDWLYVTETISVGDKDHTSSLFIIPSFNFPNLWTTASTRALAYFTHGIVLLEIVDGKFTEFKRSTNSIDRRSKEKL